MGHGEVGEGVVEEVGNVGVAGGEVGGGNVDVGMTAFSLSGEVSAIDFTSKNESGALNSLPGMLRGNEGKAQHCYYY